ncbi:HGL235Wp [Eremothecium sinecaudum]|uniref:HGL235Wp n=1 Tax=Eremothecium sinecaudum TaxID=45286 RepID=A0A0X8HV83_9SACH|nr:HGL235Wp [Eremothecium sinecaudum]AMD22105.1 HGL235Wp [Eremothecium sinecaudum]
MSISTLSRFLIKQRSICINPSRLGLQRNLMGTLNPTISYSTRNVVIKQSLYRSSRHYSSKPGGEINGYLHRVNKAELEKDRLLAQTRNPFQKLLIHLRWSLKRSTKPFNTDDIGAFISWILVSNVIMIILATTTFASLIIYLTNTVFAQEYVATQIGNLITRNGTVSVVFEKAIVPGWSSGKICFKNVFVSRRPTLAGGFAKGSQQEAVERAKLALSEQLLVNRHEFDDATYTQYDLTIDQVEISLSFSKWLNGKGILDEVTISGLRGLVDRTHVVWEENDDPRRYLNVYQPGDFHISNFKMNDVLFTLYQPGGFRPFQVSIFNCELPQLRKHWLFFDILNASSMSGTYDDSMFTIHRKFKKTEDGDSSHWRTYTRMRVDNLNVDHLNAGVEGPFSWIRGGQVDMIGDILLPEDDMSPADLTDMISSIGDWLLKEAYRHSPLAPFPTEQKDNIDPRQYFIMDFFLRLHNVQAEVPLFAPELSYINNALIRPIVGYINSKRSYIPIKCRVVKNISDFEGSWTIYDSVLMDDLSAEVYDAFAKYVADDERKNLRLKRVGFWSLQILIQLILMSLGAIA